VSQAYFGISLAYVALFAALGALELYRVRATGPDAITIFMLIFVLECCIPGVGIYAALPLSDADAPTGNWVIDRIFQSADLTKAILVFELTVWFVFFFYVGASSGRMVLRRLFPGPIAAQYRLEGVGYRYGLILFGGVILTLVSFYLLGDNMVDRYANLIQLRAYSEDVERTNLNAYAFSLTQTWGWLSIPALFVFYERGGRGWAWLACLACAVLFAILGVSRRGFIIPLLLCYFTVVLNDGRWRLRVILAMMIPIMVWIAYGKEILSVIAFGGTATDVTERYDTFTSAVLRASAEQGLTIVESLGTFSFIDGQPRLGVDHLLSIAQKFPFRAFGFDMEFPKRMVRISTEAFSTPENQDIPPGLFGQMWLDYRVMGPVAWGLFIGLQMSAVQFLFERCRRNLQSSAFVALTVFLIALPIDTGSYDFTISIDVFATVVVFLLVYRFRRLSAAT
jgi:hypothetical protein